MFAFLILNNCRNERLIERLIDGEMRMWAKVGLIKGIQQFSFCTFMSFYDYKYSDSTTCKVQLMKSKGVPLNEQTVNRKLNPSHIVH